MQVVVWIILILAVLFFIWLFRRRIRRIIFILILLVLAFFIYGIFNPSGAARVWYNVRTFPSRMSSRMGSGKEFLDYNTYKSKISSIGDNIGDTISDNINLEENFGSALGSDDELDGGVESSENGGDKQTVEKNETDDNSKDKAVKTFPRSVDFINIFQLKEKNKSKDKSDNVGPLTGYSKTDLLGVINKYIEKNLDDDTDILVTVEYENDVADPQKIILQVQDKTSGILLYSGNSMNNIFENDHGVNSESALVSSSGIDSINHQGSSESQKSLQSDEKTMSTKLTQKEQKEAEEIFSILF